MTDSNLIVMAAVGTGVVLQLATCYVLVRQRRAAAEVNERLSHLSSALSLLADTTEGALRDFAVTLERLHGTPEPRSRSRTATTRRIKAAARRGRSAGEIAAAEQVSESEIRLRLQLAEASGRSAGGPAAVAADR